MKTAHDDKQEAETIRDLRDCGYTQKCVAEAMGLHLTQVHRIARRNQIRFEHRRRDPPHQESGVYTLDISIRQWRRIGAAVQRWSDIIGTTEGAVSMVSRIYGIPVGAVECWMRGDEHLLD